MGAWYRATTAGLIVTAVLSVHSAAAQVEAGGFYENRSTNGFYERKAEGWFWYEREPELAEPEEPEEPKPVPIPPSPPVAEKASPDPAPPVAFTAAWVRENLPKYREAAWNDPTVENLTVYLMVQRFAMDRSEQFAEAAELAVIGNPYLDEITRRPAAVFASQKIDKAAGENRTDLVSQIAQQAGILFFYEDDCQMCEIQAPILRMIAQNSGFDILPVSKTGNPLSGDIFNRFLVDEGQAERMGVVAYPAMFLLRPDGKYAAIGQGMMSLTELNQRIIVAANREGWISQEQYTKTRPFLNASTSLSERLADSLSEGDSTNQGADFIPPEQLYQHIQQLMRGDTH